MLTRFSSASSSGSPSETSSSLGPSSLGNGLGTTAVTSMSYMESSEGERFVERDSSRDEDDDDDDDDDDGDDEEEAVAVAGAEAVGREWANVPKGSGPNGLGAEPFGVGTETSRRRFLGLITLY